MQILGKAVSPKAQTNLIGAPSFALENPYGLYDCYKSDEFAGQYPNIRPIVNELMTIPAHSIDANGKPVPSSAVNALYHPNRTDSYVLFMEKLGVSVLSLDYTYVLVWRKDGGVARPGGNYGIKGKNIGGFTFLENPGITYRDGKIIYTMGSQEFTDNEVMAIPGGAKPGNLYGGYSPARASAKWATVDGYIGDFQKGFFENNAIPAGVFQVVAATTQDYKDMVAKLQERHRGAGANNNVSYSHVPIDATGKTQQAQITWVPFSQSNKDIDFKNLLDHVDNRLSEAYGVSSIIKGVDSAAKYSNAEVSEANFAKRAVNPLALRIFTQITHELNRITGGLGVAITYTYEIPAVSDAELVKAKTRREEVSMIKELIDMGYSLDSAVDALNLSQSYKLLKLGNGAATIDNDKPEVDEGDEVKDAPDRYEIDGVTPLNKGEANSTNPKAKLTDEEKLEKVAKDYLERQLDRCIDEYRETTDAPVASVKAEVQPEPTNDEMDEFVVAMYAIISVILVTEGEIGYEDAVALAGLDISDLQGFMMPDIAEDAYRAYLRRVATTYGNDTAASIQKVLLDSKELGLTRKETEAALENIMNTDDYRVKRLARTELNNSQNIGKLEGVKSLAAEVGGTWEKTINHTAGGICPLCASQEGIWTEISQPLWAEGEAISTINDKGDTVIYINDWQTNDASDYHPNGRGSLLFRRTI